ncbi:MAG: restriction endonuclease subunit S [Candidatus Heimdallarchaeota archaeon]|nr:MAG: restriction endonuclease subunit S [Candidatus Heimdallarchaeota archaeon]
MISEPTTQFKETEVGTIPVDWKIKRINQVAKINELHIDKTFIHKEIDYIDISSVKEGRIVEVKRISTSQAPSRAKRVVRNNDILISTVRPNLKHYTFISDSSEQLIASTGFVVISAKNIDPRFLYYYLTNKYYTDFLAAIAETHTSAYPAFTPDVILKSFIPYPPISEQKRIGKVLSILDDKIKLNFMINKTIKSIGYTLFKHWFEEFKSPEENNNLREFSERSVKFSSKLGHEIPQGWRIGSIGDIVEIQAGYAFKSKDLLEHGTIGVIKIKNISENFVDIRDTQYVSREIVTKLDSKLSITSGAILIALTGANAGKMGIVPKTNRNLWLNQRVGMFKERIENGIYFIFFLLSSKKYQRILKRMAKGTAQPNISGSDIESIEIPLPPEDIIKKFGLIFDPFFQYMINNLHENEKLSDLRDNLLPKLLSGKIRV